MRRLLVLFAFCIAVSVYGSSQAVSQIAVTDRGLIGPLVQGKDGNLYGTTGGYPGTVFKVTTGGTVTRLYNFCSQTGCTDGYYPSALMLASDGNFYGTTVNGGQPSCGGSTCGTVFRITPAGTLTTLFAFHNGDGKWPSGRLIQAGDGNLYGTTLSGGAHGVGTIFKITLGGTLTTIYNFGGPDGDADPFSGVIQGKDGNFYGTTEWGGTHGVGSVFKVTPGGIYTMLHSFNGTDGAWVTEGLVQASDGNFYGSTLEGGPNANGTLFRITPDGTFATLHTFADYVSGRYPSGNLLQGADGNLYGATAAGGVMQDGTIFKMTLGGGFTNLHQFNETKGEGVGPGALMQASDGNFYGGTGSTVFRLWANSHNLVVTAHDYSNFHGTVTSADGRIDCGIWGVCYEQYKSTDVVTLTATPGDYREAFTDWIGCDSPKDNVCTVKMDKDRQITAEFHPLYSLSVGKYGNGTVVSSDGHINCGKSCYYDSYLDGSVVTLTPTPDPEWAFSQWWGCDSVQSNNNCQIKMKWYEGATVYFVPGHALSVSKSGNGFVASSDGYISCGPNCSYNYIVGRSVTLTASPESNWSFFGWSGCDQTYANTCTVAMNSVRNVAATFTPPHQLSVSFTGSGAITSTDSYINCGSICSHTYMDSTMVNLIASPQSGWGVAAWNGCDRTNLNTCYVGMKSDRSVSATFNLLYALSVSKAGTGSGGVSSADGHIYCGSLCSYSYVGGTTVTLSAIPSPGSTFTGWSNCDNVKGSYCLAAVSGAKNVTANFDAVTQVTLTSLTCKPTYVKGGQLSAGTLTLSGPAPSGGLSIALTSDHPAVAHPPSWVFVPAGKTSIQFAINTYPVKSNTSVTITATSGSSQASGTLTVGATSLPPSLH